MSEVTVLGIFVADLSFSANKIPTTGETLLGDKYNIGPGGKGCNQAIALARLGCNVNFISKIGNDDYGKLALDSLKQNKIDTSNIIISKEHQTGVAGIHVDSNTGQNAITVVRGAPASFTKDEIDINEGPFVIYQGSHGDRGAHRADIIFPSAAYTEEAGIFVNTEGRPQTAVRASFPPGEAKENWAVLRALSGALEKPLPFDNIEALRSKLFEEIPFLREIDIVPKNSILDLKDQKIKDKKINKKRVDFYKTNPIARASQVMSELSNLDEIEKKLEIAAE